MKYFMVKNGAALSLSVQRNNADLSKKTQTSLECIASDVNFRGCHFRTGGL